jgi:F420-dependent oxidoreductase-like protein
MKYGVTLPQGWPNFPGVKDPVEAFETMIAAAKAAEECRFESIWVADHLMPLVLHPPYHEEDILFECWATTAALARETTRVRIAQAVTCNVYRPPALLAKMASTVDVISHGRLTLGIGAGDYEEEVRAYGYECPPVPERLWQLREAVQVILAMWTQEEPYFEGKYYQVRGAINQPKGVQQPHIPLLIGGDGEKVTLKIVAQYANACHLIAPMPVAIARKFAVLKGHCEAVGRDYERIWRTATAACAIGDTDEQALNSIPDGQKDQLIAQLKAVRKRLGQGLAQDHAIDEGLTAIVSGDPAVSIGLVGGPETIRRRIAAYEEAGVQELRLYFLGGANPEVIRRFAAEFIA